MRQVVVGFEIEPGSTLDEPHLRDATPRVERLIADLAKKKFPYLEWVPASTASPASAPRFELRLVDGQSEGCSPPAVRANFRARKGNTDSWTYPALDLTEVCDLGALELTASDLLDAVRKLTTDVLADAPKMEDLESNFLSQIVLARELLPDFEREKLYVPVPCLEAKPESELEVRFANQTGKFLIAYPGDIDGDRTQLFVGSFRCEQIESGEQEGPPRRPWDPLLPRVLELCHEPFVYMRVYKPSGPCDVQNGVVTRLDEGGTS